MRMCSHLLPIDIKWKKDWRCRKQNRFNLITSNRKPSLWGSLYRRLVFVCLFVCSCWSVWKIVRPHYEGLFIEAIAAWLEFLWYNLFSTRRIVLRSYYIDPATKRAREREMERGWRTNWVRLCASKNVERKNRQNASKLIKYLCLKYLLSSIKCPFCFSINIMLLPFLFILPFVQASQPTSDWVNEWVSVPCCLPFVYVCLNAF